MAIQNGTERIEKMRSAMHREIDKLIDDVILNQHAQGFSITFDCGVDRLLSKTLTTDTIIQDDDGRYVYIVKGDIESTEKGEETD